MPKSKSAPLPSGKPAAKSGQYEQVGPKVGNTGGQEVTLPKGHTLLSTDKPGQGYKLVAPTRNKSGILLLTTNYSGGKA